jgi:hypothetical protein
MTTPAETLASTTPAEALASTTPAEAMAAEHVASGDDSVPHGDDARTHLIRRAPLDAVTTTVPAQPAALDPPSPATAVAASAVAIVGGWAPAVVATELITGWWQSDRLFCLAVGFLSVLFGAATVTGVILLLLRRSVGRWMVVFGAAVALLTFGSVFIAGARLAWPVYFVPLLPLTSLLLALNPAARRWSDG